MNHFKKTLLVTIILAAMAVVPTSARNYMVPKAYMFGFIASFNDSIVFFTCPASGVLLYELQSKQSHLRGHQQSEAQRRREEIPEDDQAIHGEERRQVRCPLRQRLRVQVPSRQHGRQRPAIRPQT